MNDAVAVALTVYFQEPFRAGVFFTQTVPPVRPLSRAHTRIAGRILVQQKSMQAPVTAQVMG